jgi:hypothetical protein
MPLPASWQKIFVPLGREYVYLTGHGQPVWPMHINEKPPDIMHYDEVSNFYSNHKLNLWSSGIMSPYTLVDGYQNL